MATGLDEDVAAEQAEWHLAQRGGQRPAGRCDEAGAHAEVRVPAPAV
jgi:hypothetical protein